MACTDGQKERDESIEWYHEIPSSTELRNMTFLELAELLQTCNKGSTKFLAVDRELKKRIARDQAEINRKNILIGVCIGGVFTIVGALLGAFIRGCQQ